MLDHAGHVGDFVTLALILTFKVFKKDYYVIISRTFEIEKWEYVFWKAREKVARGSVLRFLIRPIVSEIISLDVSHQIFNRNLISVSLKMFYVRSPLLVDTSGLLRVVRPHI